MEMTYKVLIMYDKEYQGYVVDVPELTGCMSQGKTLDEALQNIKDAITGWLYVENKHRQEEPETNQFAEMFFGEVTV
jgi:predicted RNase H-like HicB family nuclease